MTTVKEIHNLQLKTIEKVRTINKTACEIENIGTATLEELRRQYQQQDCIMDDISSLENKQVITEKLQDRFDFWNFTSSRTVGLFPRVNNTPETLEITPEVSRNDDDFVIEIQSFSLKWSESTFVQFSCSRRQEFSNKDYCRIGWAPIGDWEYGNDLESIYKGKVGKRSILSFYRRRKWGHTNTQKPYSTGVQTVKSTYSDETIVFNDSTLDDNLSTLDATLDRIGKISYSMCEIVKTSSEKTDKMSDKMEKSLFKQLVITARAKSQNRAN